MLSGGFGRFAEYHVADEGGAVFPINSVSAGVRAKASLTRSFSVALALIVGTFQRAKGAERGSIP